MFYLKVCMSVQTFTNQIYYSCGDLLSSSTSVILHRLYHLFDWGVDLKTIEKLVY